MRNTSAYNLLVDSLTHSASTADSEMCITVKMGSSTFFRYLNFLRTLVSPLARAYYSVHTWFVLPFSIYRLFLQQIRSIMDWLPNFI